MGASDRVVTSRPASLVAVVVTAFGLLFVAGPVAAETRVNASVTTVVHNAAEQLDWDTRVGSPIHAQVQVAGWADRPYPTGQGSYKIFRSLDCSGTPVNGASHALIGGSRYAWYDFSGYAYTPTTAADLSVQAYYAGDSTYYPGRGDCMTVRVDKALATVRVAVHDEWHRATDVVYVSRKAHAAVEVTSRVSPGPTGLVTFRWFANGACTGDPKYTRTATLGPGGRLDLADFGFTSGSEGVAAFQVRYAGDPRYEAGTSGCADYAVEKAAAHLTTWVHDALHNPVSEVPSAKPVHVATSLTGTIGAPTGTISVESYATPGCSGAHGELSQAASMGVDPAGMSFGHAGPSSIWLQVRYSGDWRYDPAVGPCMRLDWLAAATPLAATASPGAATTGSPGGATGTEPPTASGGTMPTDAGPSMTAGVGAPTGSTATGPSPATAGVAGPSSSPGQIGPNVPSADTSSGAAALVMALLAAAAVALVGFGWWRRRNRRGGARTS